MSSVNAIQVIQGDITTLPVDAIVNAANSSLMGGGGVDGAIHRVGGPAILEECRAIVAKKGGCACGEAVITTAGKLPAKFVIHTVGPFWKNSGDEGRLLRNCYCNSLKLALAHGCKSVAFPNISTGIYGYPKKEAADVAVQAVWDILQANILLEVVFCCFDSENYELTKGALTARLE